MHRVGKTTFGPPSPKSSQDFESEDSVSDSSCSRSNVEDDDGDSSNFGPPMCSSKKRSRVGSRTYGYQDCGRKHQTVGGSNASFSTQFQQLTNHSCIEAQDASSTAKHRSIELRLLRQPEEHHRARYMSEGSRGAVKDRSGKSHVTVQLSGWRKTAVLEIFAGRYDSGDRVVPHELYKVIPVTGKGGQSNTPCKLASKGGMDVIQVTLHPEDDMIAVLDCVGILKVCGYNLKRGSGARPKKSSASVCLVCRTTIPKNDGSRATVTLQIATSPILCVQQLGHPEIHRLSTESCSVVGGKDLFIIGRNFTKDTTVVFQEVNKEGKIKWSSHSEAIKEHLHQCHLICSIPTYRDLNIKQQVEVSCMVNSGKRSSKPISFTYTPKFDTVPKIDRQSRPVSPALEVPDCSLNNAALKGHPQNTINPQNDSDPPQNQSEAACIPPNLIFPHRNHTSLLINGSHCSDPSTIIYSNAQCYYDQSLATMANPATMPYSVANVNTIPHKESNSVDPLSKQPSTDQLSPAWIPPAIMHSEVTSPQLSVYQPIQTTQMYDFLGTNNPPGANQSQEPDIQSLGATQETQTLANWNAYSENTHEFATLRAVSTECLNNW